MIEQFNPKVPVGHAIKIELFAILILALFWIIISSLTFIMLVLLTIFFIKFFRIV